MDQAWWRHTHLYIILPIWHSVNSSDWRVLSPVRRAAKLVSPPRQACVRASHSSQRQQQTLDAWASLKLRSRLCIPPWMRNSRAFFCMDTAALFSSFSNSKRDWGQLCKGSFIYYVRYAPKGGGVRGGGGQAPCVCQCIVVIVTS